MFLTFDHNGITSIGRKYTKGRHRITSMADFKHFKPYASVIEDDIITTPEPSTTDKLLYLKECGIEVEDGTHWKTVDKLYREAVAEYDRLSTETDTGNGKD